MKQESEEERVRDRGREMMRVYA